MMADSPPAIVMPVQLATPSGQLIGIQALGPKADLKKLEHFTRAAGFPCQQMDSPDGRELMIAFPPGSDRAKVDEFLQRIPANFPTLTISPVALPEG